MMTSASKSGYHYTMDKKHFIKQSFILTEKKTWVSVSPAAPSESIPHKFFWLHMECDEKETGEWLYEQRDIADGVIEGLLAEDTRPRMTAYPDGYPINLRGINTEEGGDAHDMISIRMFVQKHRIVSTSKRYLHAEDELAELLRTEDAPEDAGGFLLALLELLVDRAESCIIELKEDVYDLEYKIIDESDTNQRRHLNEIRRKVITFSRFFSPQKDAAVKLANIREKMFTPHQIQGIKECINKLSKIIEDLDAIDNRCYVLQDEIAAITNDKINKKMYFISVMATVFLPLTFLTGLLGVNLGGIPGASSDRGFFNFLLILSAVLVLQIIILIKSKKF